MKFIEKVLEIIAWVQIILFPIFISLILAGLIFYFIPSSFGIICAVFIVFTGLVIGVVYANKIHKKEGTVNHMGKLLRTPELEENHKDKDNSHLNE